MAKSGFAYFDRYGILHVVGDKKTADTYSSGKVVETKNIPFANGYPKKDEKSVIVYGFGCGEVFVGGNAKNGKEVAYEDIAFLAETLAELMA